MRYSRMLSKPPRKKKGYANLIIIAIILGVTAYFVTAGAAGGWLAENIINPVFNNTGEAIAGSPTPSPLPSSAPNDTAQAIEMPESSVTPKASAGDRVEEQIAVESLVLYTLQAGAFSDKANADTAANTITSRGGAGYVLNDNNLYRALIAGYLNEADAKNVKTELENQGVTNTIYKIESGSLEFKIAAGKNQIDAIKACFALVKDSVTSLQQIIYDADSGQNVNERITALKTNAKNVVSDLKNVVTTNSDATSHIVSYMDSFCATLDKIPASTDVSAVAFSSALKYNIISITADYKSFLSKLSS